MLAEGGGEGFKIKSLNYNNSTVLIWTLLADPVTGTFFNCKKETTEKNRNKNIRSL